MGDVEGAQAAYAEAAQIQPLIKRPAAKLPAEFRVLALYAPFGGNTPTEYLFKDAVHDTDTLALFAAREYDSELFRQNVQVVVNLISDADQAEALLPLAAELADRLNGQPSTIRAKSRARHGMPSRRCCRGYRVAASRKRCGSKLALIAPWRRCRRYFRFVEHSGAAGRNPWRR